MKDLSNRSVAGLLHWTIWEADIDEVRIAPGIKLCRTEGSSVEKLYEALCIATGIDGGEPFEFGSYILLEPEDVKPALLPFGDPYSLFDRLCNVVAIITSQPISLCRVIESSDGFRSCEDTHIVYTYGGQTEFLTDSNKPIDDDRATEICKAWAISQRAWETEKSRGRLANAQTYFYYAWRSPYIEPICLNLAIVLEVLFAPHSQSEVSHQISFNVSKFVGKTEHEREQIYKAMKKFYNFRSTIVHGGIPSDEKFIDITVEVFHLCSNILRTILINEKIALAFEDEHLRRKMLFKFLFE
jgi:hypothetical protein